MENNFYVEGMDYGHFLIGQLTAFSNRYQTVADKFFEDISWKQCFALVCINMFEKAPTINELSEVLGSSHQNVKQLLLKLEKTGYIEFVKDETDKRKQRIIRTAKANEFDEKHKEPSEVFMKKFFENIDEEQIKEYNRDTRGIRKEFKEYGEMGMKTLVTFQSKTGFTKKYAQWIAEDLSADLEEVSKLTKEKVSGYDLIIHGGWIMGGMDPKKMVFWEERW